jgi:xanthine/CO dehydrogenase XdhC/CoxF family maturation factor
VTAREFAALAKLGREALTRCERAVLAHLVGAEGSHYRRVGARAVLAEDGSSAGAISAGCLEADLAQRIPAVHQSNAPILVEYDLPSGDDSVWGLGLGCGGRLAIRLVPVDETVVADLEEISAALSRGETARVETELPGGGTLVEEVEPAISLLVCGAGSDAVSVASQALLLGWNVEVVAPRAGAAALRRFENLGITLRAPGDIASLARRRRTAAIVMTHGFLDDMEMLARLASAPLAYLGILGPRERTRRLEQALASDGIGIRVSEERAHAPAGLDIGAETPEEIALAIAAEIQARLTGARGGFLKDRSGPIHPLSGVVDHPDVTGVAIDARVDEERFVRGDGEA